MNFGVKNCYIQFDQLINSKYFLELRTLHNLALISVITFNYSHVRTHHTSVLNTVNALFVFLLFYFCPYIFVPLCLLSNFIHLLKLREYFFPDQSTQNFVVSQDSNRKSYSRQDFIHLTSFLKYCRTLMLNVYTYI